MPSIDSAAIPRGGKTVILLATLTQFPFMFCSTRRRTSVSVSGFIARLRVPVSDVPWAWGSCRYFHTTSIGASKWLFSYVVDARHSAEQASGYLREPGADELPSRARGDPYLPRAIFATAGASSANSFAKKASAAFVSRALGRDFDLNSP